VTGEQARAERFAELFQAVYLTFHRRDDPGDRRRTLIWLTPAGHEALRRNREVLGVDLLARAMARLPPGQADALNAAMRALTECAQSDGVRTALGRRKS
jgi:hypothetical protein